MGGGGGGEPKQVGFSAHSQTASHSSFTNDTEIKFIDLRRII